MPLRSKIEEAGTDEVEGHMPRVKVPDAAVESDTDGEDTEGHRRHFHGAEVEEADTEGHASRGKVVAPAGTDDDESEGHVFRH